MECTINQTKPMSIFDAEPNYRRAVMLGAAVLRQRGNSRSNALKRAWVDYRDWKSSQTEINVRAEVNRQSFFLRRRRELKEEHRLKAFKQARERAGNLSKSREKAWAATLRSGGSMSGGLAWELCTKLECAAA